MERSNKPEKRAPVKTAADLQRLKLEKLLRNVDKPAHIPEPPRSRSFPAAPEFVRNVMGSSAGAGSGEFHVYRHIRRREYARVKNITQQAEKDELDEAYALKLDENKRAAEERTAKKRAKRLKRKARRLENQSKRPRQPDAGRPDGSDSDDVEQDAEDRDVDESDALVRLSRPGGADDTRTADPETRTVDPETRTVDPETDVCVDERTDGSVIEPDAYPVITPYRIDDLSETGSTEDGTHHGSQPDYTADGGIKSSSGSTTDDGGIKSSSGSTTDVGEIKSSGSTTDVGEIKSSMTTTDDGGIK